MAIEGLNFNSYNPNYAVTGHQGRVQKPLGNEYGYNQNSMVNPYDKYSAALSRRYSVEDMELAQKIATGNVDSSLTNPFVQQGVKNVSGLEGAAFAGFKIPENNGTGELSPKYNESERILDLKA